MIWARSAILKLEIEHMEKDIAELEQKSAESLTAEEKTKLEQIKESIVNAKDESKDVMENYETIQQDIKNGKNAFAEFINNPNDEGVEDTSGAATEADV
jgi:hypothetical protein